MELVKDCMKLGFGLMRLPQLADKTTDIEQTKQMVDAFIAAGGKYFDTAYIYAGSEPAAKEALCSRYPRESYYLADKLNAAAFACSSEEEAKNEIKVSLERTGAGYFDFYLLHGIDAENIKRYDSYGIWDYMHQLKAEGLIKHIGFSFHDEPALLEKILTDHPDMEFVQLQINYADMDSCIIASRECYDIATRHGVPIIVMEPVKGGTLANPPQEVKDLFFRTNPEASMASWAIRYVASLPNVMVVLSGMSNMQQMNDNLSFMKEFKPIDEFEQKVIEEAREIITRVNSIPCTSCHYCTPGCPMEIHIPEIFSVMNEYKSFNNLAEARNNYGWRPGGPKASVCIQCGQCEEACPQHLPIISLLQEVVDTLEK